MKTSPRRQQQGVLLLEVLIALLIFALGVLGLVGLQASASKQAGQTKYRAEATLLANDLLGQMRLTSRDFTTLNAQFKSDDGGGPAYLAWKGRVAAQLPGVEDHPPLVTLVQNAPLQAIVNGVPATPTGLTSSTRVNITVRWKMPGEPPNAAPHNIALANEIR